MQSLKELYKIGNGPSSSHTMGPKRFCEYILKKYPHANKYEIYLYGSLALTGKGHLTDHVIKETFNNHNIEVIFDALKEVSHPNTMEAFIYEDKVSKETCISVGGGTIKILGAEDENPKEVYKEKTFNEVRDHILLNNLTLAEYVYQNEPGIKDYLNVVWEKMNHSIDEGLSKEGYLPGDLRVLRKAKYLFNQEDIADTKDKRTISAYAYAVSETNASGGVIVTSPTCGASGVLPATLRYANEKYGFSKEKIIDSLAVSGLIGNIIKENASISGAECGCQAEVGSACSMASAALAYLLDMNIDQIEYSAEMALEHFLGLTCDPIKGYVQIPCIERNAIASMRALDNVALAYFLTGSRKISFDMIIKTMKETGLDIQNSYKETSEGGMAKNYHEKTNFDK